MKLDPTPRFILALAAVLLTGTGQAEEPDLFRYRLKVRLDPASRTLEARAWIRSPPETHFFLHRSLTVQEITADGRGISFRREPSRPLPYTFGTAVTVDAPDPRELRVDWTGTIDEVVAGVNMISPELVELAYYTTWFPTFEGMKDFAFEMEADLPQEYVATTNGRPVSRRDADGRAVTTWTSYRPTWDMVLVASPHLRRLGGDSEGARFEAFYRNLPTAWVQARMEGLLECEDWLADLYGPNQGEGPLRLVFSPRDGWGYYRTPLIVVSEGRTRDAMGHEYWEPMDFRYGCHEIAHSWWAIADGTSRDDWINEGLAEFSAYRFTARRFDPGYAERRLGEYRQNAGRSQTSSAIAETESDSPDREVNRYDKPTLVFLEAQRRFGKKELDGFLRALYERFAGTRGATTALFLEEVGARVGDAAREFFREELYRRPAVDADDPRPGNWPGRCRGHRAGRWR